jgi:uncharacterized membrane protein YfcA
MKELVQFILLGLAAGILSGLVGIGGGILIVPSLVLLFGFTQAQAQGTTLAAMVPPIGLLAAYVYYQKGNVNINSALFIAVGFIVGGLLGAKIANNMSNYALQKVFAVVLILVGIKMLFSK